jgi:hypothetical protein
MRSWLDRTLIGSNCVNIERGRQKIYVSCYECKIEDAITCVTTMRSNHSSNVGLGCNMHSLMDSYQSEGCCPKFGSGTSNSRIDLLHVGSAYPEALRCVRRVGCSKTTLYTQLLAECESVCPAHAYYDVRDNGPICFANFNASASITNSLILSQIIILLLLVLFLI